MKKALAFFVALCMFLSLCTGVLTPLKSVRAAGSWYVDPTGTDDADHGTGTGTAAFKTIQYAVGNSSVAAGDTISVAAGAYAGDVVISKQLNLIGAGAETTTITGSGTGVVVTIMTSSVTLSGFTVTGAGPNPLTCAGIGLSDVTGCMVSQNAVVSCINGIALIHASTNIVGSNTITGSGCYGIYVGTDTAPSTDNVIQTNTITGSGRDGIYVDKDCNRQTITGNTVSGTAGNSTYGAAEGNGMYFWKSSGHTVTGNTISGNAMPASQVGYGIEMYGSSNNTITRNTIRDNYDGLHIRNIKEDENPGYSIRNNIIHQNKIYDNTRVNLYADPNFAFDATNNWWGSADGAVIVSKIASYTETPGLIQPGTHVFIDYAPWYANEGLTDFGPVMRTSGGVNTGYTTIQTALDAAADGDVITVAAGSYAGATITKSVTLRGANTGTAGKDPGRAGESIITSVLNISGQNNTVVIDGFEFTAANYAAMYGNTPGYWTDVTFENNLFNGAGPIYTDTGANTWRNVTLTRNKFAGSPNNAVQLYIHGAGVVTDNDFENVGVSTKNNAIVAMGLAGLTVTGNTFKNIGYNALQLVGMTGNLLVTGNSIDGTGYEAIKLGGPIPSGAVSGNTIIHAATASRSVSGEEDRGAIRLRGVTLPYSVVIEGNVLQDSFTGIGVKPGENLTGTTIAIRHNTITGNIYGVYNSGTTGSLDVRNNWWGSVNGPVAGTNVQQVMGSAVYCPWAMNGADYPSFTAALSLVPSTGTTKWANGDTFDMAVHFDVAGVNVNALDTTIAYDPAHLTVTGVDWATGNPFVQGVEHSFNTTAGTVTIAAGQASAMNGPFAASGDVAIIHFRTVAAASSTAIAFDAAKTSVMMPNSENINNPVNVLTGTTGATATISDITITAAADSNGSITPAGSTTLAYGASQSYTITPSIGYRIASVLVDGVAVTVTDDARMTYAFTNVTTSHTIAVAFSQTAALTLNVTGCEAGLTTTLGVAPGSYSPITGTMMDGYLLLTNNVAANEYWLQFASGTSTNNTLASQMFGLTLNATPEQKAALKAYYAARGVADPYLTYLNGAADGTNPFAYIDGANLTLRDGARYFVNGAKSAMAIPGDFPEGTYTVNGTLTDVYGNTTPVTFKLIVARANYTITAAADSNGSITPAGSTTLAYGASQSYTITPSIGYRIASVLVDGVAVTVTDDARMTYAFTNVTTSHTIAVAFSQTAALTLTVGGCEAGLTTTLGVAPGSYSPITGTMMDGYLLLTNSVAANEYWLQFASGTSTSNTLKSDMFALNLVSTAEQTAALQAYYAARGVTDPYLTYLNGAANGTNPFAFVDGSNLMLCDGARYSLNGAKSAMAIPGDFPEGTYSVNGTLTDVYGNTTSVTFKLIVARTNYTVTLASSSTHVASITPGASQPASRGSTVAFIITPEAYYYIYSVNGAASTDLTDANRNLGLAVTVTSGSVLSPTTITVNIFRRGDIAGNAGGPDTAVDTQDLSVLISEWHTSGQLADLNCSGFVDIKDLSMMMSLWQSVH